MEMTCKRGVRLELTPLHATPLSDQNGKKLEGALPFVVQKPPETRRGSFLMRTDRAGFVPKQRDSPADNCEKDGEPTCSGHHDLAGFTERSQTSQ
jgi:hypothetical protein